VVAVPTKSFLKKAPVVATTTEAERDQLHPRKSSFFDEVLPRSCIAAEFGATNKGSNRRSQAQEIGYPKTDGAISLMLLLRLTCDSAPLGSICHQKLCSTIRIVPTNWSCCLASNAAKEPAPLILTVATTASRCVYDNTTQEQLDHREPAQQVKKQAPELISEWAKLDRDKRTRARLHLIEHGSPTGR